MAPTSPSTRSGAASNRGIGLDGVVSLVVGLALLYVYPRLLRWLSHQVFETPFAPFFADGREVPYTSVPAFWLDLGVTAFAVAMVFEGLVVLLLGRLSVAIWAAVAVYGAAVVLNIGLLMARPGGGFPIVSAIAVLVGLWSIAGLVLRRR